jgi:WD40 repeat protein
VTAATFLPDGAHVALGTAGGHVEILSAATFERVAEHAFGAPGAPPSGVVALDVAPRGGELVVAGADRALRFRAPFPPADARPPPKFFDFRAVSWDPTATYVLALGQQAGPRSVRVLDVARGQSTSLQSAHRGSITCAAFVADGTAAITGATDGSVHVWSTRDGAPLVQRAGLGAAVTSLAQVAGPAGPSVAAGLADGRVRVFPLDPLAAARKRQPRALADWEQRRERALAAPLPFD